MTLIRVKVEDVPEDFRYNGDFSGIIRIETMHKQAYINAICMTSTNRESAIQLGVSDAQLQLFIKEHGIHIGMQKAMRAEFKSRKIRVKLRNHTQTRSIAK